MSKFTVKVELQGYEVKLQGLKFSVEGTKEDAPKIAQQIERQLSGMIQAPTVMAPTSLAPVNGNPHPTVIDAEIETDNNGAGKKRKAKRYGGGGRKLPPRKSP